jgi:uncharacterized membrane protein YoaK (UPF0700 family)
MTIVTGLIDAVGYVALGSAFPANMKGNVVLLGFAGAHVSGLSMTRSLTALGAALLGGVIAGYLEGAHRLHKKCRWLVLAGAAEVLLLFAVTLVTHLCAQSTALPVSGGLALIVLTAASMGIRNGTVRHLGVVDITTMVLTLTMAALSSESSTAGGINPGWIRRTAAILTTLGGAYLGAILLRYSLSTVLALSKLITFCVVILQSIHVEATTDVALHLAARRHSK